MAAKKTATRAKAKKPDHARLLAEFTQAVVSNPAMTGSPVWGAALGGSQEALAKGVAERVLDCAQAVLDEYEQRLTKKRA